MSTNMNFNKITKKNKDKYVTKRITFADGVTLDIDTHFRETKIDAMIKESLETSAKAIDEKKEITDAIAYTLFVALTIKYFTSIAFSGVGCDALLYLVSELQDGGYFDDIMSTFDSKEIEILHEKFNVKLNNVVAAMNNIMKAESENEQAV